MTQFDDKEKLDVRKTLVKQIFDNSIEKFGLTGSVLFSGFFNRDGNLRANHSAHELQFNERFLGLQDPEIERWSWHECQHGVYGLENSRMTNDELVERNLFIFHPEFEDFRARMLSHYKKYKETGYPFSRVVPDIPPVNTLETTNTYNKDYTYPDEVLALLMGYRCYLGQGGVGPIDPAEFIEAFKPEDLKFLDTDQRNAMNEWVKANKPKVVVVKNID